MDKVQILDILISIFSVFITRLIEYFIGGWAILAYFVAIVNTKEYRAFTSG